MRSLWLLPALFLLGCNQTAEPVTVVLPEGYRGHVVLVYGVPGAG